MRSYPTPRRMHFQQACEILELNEDEAQDDVVVKRQYRRLALLNHPDKNPDDPDATETFQQIHEAYELLLSSTSTTSSMFFTDASSSSYQDLLFEYLTALMRPSSSSSSSHGPRFQDVATQLFYTIAERLTTKCEEKAVGMLERMDKPTFTKVYGLLKKCSDVLRLPEEWRTRLDELHRSKTEHDQTMLLQPRLEDLMEDKVFRVTLEGHTFYIPLWHHELVYDNPHGDDDTKKGGELTVRCVPTLPSNMTLDEQNHLHVHIQHDKSLIWNVEQLSVPIIQGKTLSIDRSTLQLREHQRITFKGHGVPRIHETDIYDVSKRADIVVHLRFK